MRLLPTHLAKALTRIGQMSDDELDRLKSRLQWEAGHWLICRAVDCKR